MLPPPLRWRIYRTCTKGCVNQSNVDMNEEKLDELKLPSRNATEFT